MNITITCRHKTNISRYKRKILQELRSTKYLDQSIRQIKIVFSRPCKNDSSIAPVECRMSVQSSSGRQEFLNSANSEIRTFNLCFEAYLSQTLKREELKLADRKIKKVFPYISVPPEFNEDTTFYHPGMRL